MNKMKMSDSGKQLIRESEGLRLKSYPDPGTGGFPFTIAYGTTVIKGKPVKLGMTCTKEQAEEYLTDDLVKFETEVCDLVKVKLTQGQFDALVDFAYNVGSNNLRKSTLLKLLNAGDYTGASNEFLKWNKAAGKVLAGLTKRRAAERNLFIS